MPAKSRFAIKFSGIQGTRQETPHELTEQFPLIKEVLDALHSTEESGYEADDIIGTLTKTCDRKDLDVLIVTGDKDMLQLVNDRVMCCYPKRHHGSGRYDRKAIDGKYGLKPAQIIDLKGLMGDASDNIPGIPGVGEKTALKLLRIRRWNKCSNMPMSCRGKIEEKVKDHQDALKSK